MSVETEATTPAAADAGDLVKGEAPEPSNSEPIDLLGNNKVVKTILRNGSGPYPQKGANVKVHYTGTLEDGTKFDSSLDRNVPFEFQLGAMRVIKGWEVCVASMRTGEKCSVKLHPDFAYGASGSPPTIPPNSTLIFEIELLNYNNRKEKWAMSCDEKLTAAAELKEEGTSHFKEQKWDLAVASYKEAAELMEKLEDWPEDQYAAAKSLYLACYGNVALAQMKLKNWLEVSLATTTVLKLDPQNVKALYRRGLARSELDDFDRAADDLTAAMALSPDDGEIARALTLNRKKRKEADDKVRGLYKKMF